MPHVLVAHTSIGARTLLDITFRRKRYSTDIVSSPTEALTAASHYSPDLAILNITFEAASGFTLAADLRALHPNLPIMIFSRDVSRDDIFLGTQRDILVYMHGIGHDFNSALHSLLKRP